MAADQTASAVARIAYLTSDLVIDSQPQFPATSVFAQEYASLVESASSSPRLLVTPSGADPGSTILQNPTNLTSLTATSSSHLLIHLVLHLVDLSSRPVVLHIAVDHDLSDVLLLRSAIPFFFLSNTAQQAHDNALLAARLARIEKKAVVHAFYLLPGVQIGRYSSGAPNAFFPRRQTTSFPPVEEGYVSREKLPNGYANGYANGHDVIGQSSNGWTPIDDPSVISNFNAYRAVAAETQSQVGRSLPNLVVRGPQNPEQSLLLSDEILPFRLKGLFYRPQTSSIPYLIPSFSAPSLLLSSVSSFLNKYIAGRRSGHLFIWRS